MNTTLYLSFLLASLVILALPGPSFAYAVAVGLRASGREIAFNAIGMALGGLCITLALAFGVAQVLAASPRIYAGLQVAGCLYLVGLGVAALRNRPTATSAVAQAPRLDRSTLWALLQGFVVETANPKAILFYASLLPQFTDPSLGDLPDQFLVLGASFVALQVGWDLLLMLGVRHMRASASQRWRSAGTQRLVARCTGVTFITLGLALLLQDRPIVHASP